MRPFRRVFQIALERSQRHPKAGVGVRMDRLSEKNCELTLPLKLFGLRAVGCKGVFDVLRDRCLARGVFGKPIVELNLPLFGKCGDRLDA